MLQVLHQEFMQNAVLAGLLVSIASGIIGTFVVVNRIVFCCRRDCPCRLWRRGDGLFLSL